MSVGLILAIAGIKEPPDDMLKGIIWTYVKKYLRGFTFEDMKLAFLMNAAGEFPRRVEHYGLFDVSFISGVMDQYLTCKQSTMSRARALLAPPVVKETTPEEAYNGLKEYCVKHGEFPEYWAWSKVFDYMEEWLMIEETLEKRKAFKEKVFKRMQDKMELEVMGMKHMHEREARRAQLEEEVKQECRKQMVKKWLKWV